MSAPFGRPVLPEVYTSATGSDGFEASARAATDSGSVPASTSRSNSDPGPASSASVGILKFIERRSAT